MGRILVVDDDAGMRDFLEIMLTREGYSVSTASGAEAALKQCRAESFDLVLTDLRMPKVDGIEFLKKLKDGHPDTMVVLMTAFASADTALSAMKEGAFDYLEKNFSLEDLKRVVREALEKKGIADGTETPFAGEAEVSFHGMVTKDKDMLRVFGTIRKIATTSTNVLILGESGTGKELVARAIHDCSPRRKQPFIAVNCGGVPETLLESEFFGYKKGAFTGAYADKTGLFEAARNGTIFLDEIGDLSPFLQVKLLRVVQEKTFRQIGGSDDIRANVRILSATNRDLAKLVKEGAFREDLYYRLNVVPVQLPPLRKRRDDIPLLIRHFIEKYSREFQKEVRTISAYALELLMNYPFPGNIRELENIIERSVALETSNLILPENLMIGSGKPSRWLDDDEPFPDGGVSLNDEMDAYERRLIGKALKSVKGSKTKAAELLHITVDSLKYRVDKLQIE